ncbi:MAG: DUF4838 domain-containing protein [Lentisphaerae bacterium]|nr:DUF4838 domain-containing protein [Lentisphaerota bacterium]
MSVILMLLAGKAWAESYIVKDGVPMAEIVISSEPCRSVVFAARELQTYIKKITGAELPIFPPFVLGDEVGSRLSQKYPPDLKRMPVKIYVGASWHTDRLGVVDDGLEWGAYRIISGKDWLVLLGRDTNFTPMGIWGRDREHMYQGAQEEWEKAIGDHHWVNPMRNIWLNYSEDMGMWAYDQKGTINAVCGFLRGLGVRWYMPGELGEIVPERQTIAIPDIDATVVPEVKIRDLNWAKFEITAPEARDQVLWAMRLGANLPFGYRGAHGQSNVTKSPENYEKHPDWYALYSGRRNTDSHTPNPCLSSESLFNEQLEYIRFLFDMFGVPAVCVAPTDGFTTICQCDQCRGKDTPERGRQGLLSDYVWEYTDRIARKMYMTHPDKLILGCAYSTYWLPPENIDEFSPNLAIHLVNTRRRYDIGDEALQEQRAAVKKWAQLTGNKIINYMNDGGGKNAPRLFAEDLKAYKGLLMGEEIYGPYKRRILADPGFTHLPFYVAARLWWDTDLDIDELLAEYYGQYYGPAAAEMEAFINYYEREQKNLRGINAASAIQQALDLFAKAEASVDPESIFGKRVALFTVGLEDMKKWYETIKDGRHNPPVYKLAHVSGEIKLDGKLDEEFWRDLPGDLKELHTGGEVEHKTRFKIGIKDNYLYFGVKCEDLPGEKINIAKVERHDDSALWHGDVVEFLIETPGHSYYQIAVNPAAMICDLDRGQGISFNWGSLAEVAASVNEQEGYWTIELKAPFTDSEQDPLHEIAGPVPSVDNPWYFNICRQRVRDGGNEMSAFAPNTSGEKGFHNILYFGELAP